MNVSTKTETFAPITITIDIETNAEFDAIIRFMSWNCSIPDAYTQMTKDEKGSNIVANMMTAIHKKLVAHKFQ